MPTYSNSSSSDSYHITDDSADSSSPNERPNEQLRSQFAVQGMRCQNCAIRIEKSLNKKPMVKQASVNFASEMVTVEHTDPQLTDEHIIDWIHAIGYEARAYRLDHQLDHRLDRASDVDATDGIKNELPWRLILLLFCLLPFLWGMLGMLLAQGMSWMPPLWIQFVLASFVQFVLAVPFYKSAWGSIKENMANMDVLVVVGTLAIWGYSTVVWLAQLGVMNVGSVMGGHVYFEAGVMVIAFVRLGKYLENRTKSHTLNSINLLLSLTPTVVERRSDMGDFHEVALSDVQVGDVLRAKQSSRIAADGKVIEGNGYCDESHLTGESRQLNKQCGDDVLAGALVVNGSFLYKVMSLGSQTQLGDMIQALSEAQGSKAPMARMADKVAAVFVPMVILIALVTAVVTYHFTQSIETSLLHSVSVLVIACPCALGLATPAAIMAGMGLAAKYGVWFKDAKSLEQAGNINVVVMDKTGTLTVGKPKVVDKMLVSRQIEFKDVLQLVASLEAHTSHPLAVPLLALAKQHKLPLLPVHQVQVVAGQGIMGVIDGIGLIKVGSPELTGFEFPKQMPKVWQLASVVTVSADAYPLAAFALADKLKSDAAATVKALQHANIEVVMMSGDGKSVVSHMADELGILQAYAQMNPRQKAEKIANMQTQGQKIAMVGDGVNDAAAMTQADASFAMAQATDIAQHSASAKLVGESLQHVFHAQQIAKKTLTNIKQNLFFAFIYNVIGIPLAAFGFLNPMIAAAAMALSSISVLVNALRLTYYQPTDVKD